MTKSGPNCGQSNLPNIAATSDGLPTLNQRGGHLIQTGGIGIGFRGAEPAAALPLAIKALAASDQVERQRPMLSRG